MSLCEVNIPHDWHPLAGDIGIAVKVVVFVAVVGIGIQLARDKVIDGGGYIDIVVGIGASSGKGDIGIERRGESIQVRVRFGLAGLFFWRRAHGFGINFVKSALRIETVAL